MARGKHRSAKAQRDSRAEAAQLRALREEFAQESRLLAAARSDLASVASLREELQRRTDERDRAVTAERARLLKELELLEALAQEADQHRREINRRWTDLAEAVVQSLGGGAEGVEKFMAAAGVFHGYTYRNPTEKRLGVTGAHRVQRARGQRAAAQEDLPATSACRSRAIAGLMRAAYRDVLQADEPSEADERLREADRIGEAVWAAPVTECSIDAIHAWSPLVLLDPLGVDPDPRRVVAAALGGVPGPGEVRRDALRHEADNWPPPTAALAAPARHAACAAGPAALLDAWGAHLKTLATVVSAAKRIPAPWHDPPRYASPGDAVAIRHWYTCAALGTWSRAIDRADADNDTHRGWVQAAGDAAAGLFTAAPFWLPPGQTYGFVDSEPLADSDVDEIRLPYPQVLVVLADPMMLPAMRKNTSNEFLRALGYRDVAVLDLLRKEEDMPAFGDFVVNLPDPIFNGDGIQLWEAIAHRGARIEAVLLLGDSLGRMADEFAWCLAVPGAYGGIIGRHVVPARISESKYRDEVLQLAAVSAWGSWHGPDQELAIKPGLSASEVRKLIAGAEFRSLEKRGGAAAVQVLDLKKTGGSRSTSAGTGREVTPHTRRGHYRRQHHGPKGTLVKRIRISPVVVNAHKGGFAPRVYRLPVPEDAGGSAES